jgi:hypothetical protein
MKKSIRIAYHTIFVTLSLGFTAVHLQEMQANSIASFTQQASQSVRL